MARRIAATLALLTGAASFVALAVFLLGNLPALAVAAFGLALLGWGVLRAGVSRRIARAIWLVSAAVGAVLAVLAIVRVGQNTGPYDPTTPSRLWRVALGN